MKPEDRMARTPLKVSPGRSGVQGNPPPGATVLQPIVEERVREIVKERVENRYIEVPQVYYVEKVVEVPREVPEEKIVRVMKPVKREVIKYVKKPVYIDKIVEVPEIKYVDKVVEVPRYAIKEKIVEVPKVLVIERIIPVLKSYRKEQVVYVEPGRQIPFGSQHAAYSTVQQYGQPQRNFGERRLPELAGLPPLWRHETTSPSPTTNNHGNYGSAENASNKLISRISDDGMPTNKAASGPSSAPGTPYMAANSADPLQLNTTPSIN
ncbi:Chromosome II, complete genome, related [Eimeria tenella]|uniref:Chromosome II, complete genome, related n=1 Tax=Eimeria tenella TaxID=5802 RepID=U6LCJ9_EIMTE|nr:Chromosome II, complete genome, related [Eimeria tenella]CDJ45465.1 Chromosome II, complete genome, related [Eimeria tenella]|eukprot:XP_013236211.1 Chromosome II, complete genome, related [Eimeria tenella]